MHVIQVPDYPTQVNIDILQKGVEVAVTEVEEAEKIYHAAAEARRAINKIPKGKAGSGKGAKQAANKTYTEAQKDMNQKIIDLENAKRKLKNAEQALDDFSFTQATMSGDDSGLSLGTLRENSRDMPLQSPCHDSDNSDLGSAGFDVERQDPQMNVASESPCSGAIPHMLRQQLPEELPSQQPVSKGDSSSVKSSDGSKEQSNDNSTEVDVSLGRQVNAVLESRVSKSGLIPRDLSEELAHQAVFNGNPSLNKPDSSKEQDDNFDKETGIERHWGPQVDVPLESCGQVLRSDCATMMPLGDHDGHVTSSNQTPSEGSAKPSDNPGESDYITKQLEVKKDYEKDLPVSRSPDGSEERVAKTSNNNGEIRGPVTASRVSRSTSKKKLELAGKSTEEAQGSEALQPITNEVEEDGWVVFLSDPAPETGEETAEMARFKHLALTAEEKAMYRHMNADEKKEYETKAQTAIKLYLQENKRIDFGIRRMARFDPEFLPEAATTSRNLALHFLTSREGNIMCGYHAIRNKGGYLRDGWGKPGMKVRGVPGKREIGTLDGELGLHVAQGLGSCGCMIQDILLEFALSKQISISGFVNGVRQSEMMTFHDYMEPRTRSFAFQAILFMVPDLSLNDFYTHGDALDQKLAVAKKRAHYWMKTVNDLDTEV